MVRNPPLSPPFFCFFFLGFFFPSLQFLCRLLLDLLSLWINLNLVESYTTLCPLPFFFQLLLARPFRFNYPVYLRRELCPLSLHRDSGFSCFFFCLCVRTCLFTPSPLFDLFGISTRLSFFWHVKESSGAKKQASCPLPPPAKFF